MPLEPKTRIIVDILEEHLEELAFLWMQREEAIRSNQYVAHEISALDERIEAHVQGILVGGDAAIPLLHEKLTGDDPLEVFAAAYALLRLNTETAAQMVIDYFLQATKDRLDKLCEALCHGTIENIASALEEALVTGPPPIAVAAAQVLAFHGQIGSSEPRLGEYLESEDPLVRQRAWRVVAIAGD